MFKSPTHHNSRFQYQEFFTHLNLQDFVGMAIKKKGCEDLLVKFNGEETVFKKGIR